MQKEPEIASKVDKKIEKDTETSTKPCEKVKKRKRPPINPNYKPTTVDMDAFRRRLRAESRETIRRTGIWRY